MNSFLNVPERETGNAGRATVFTGDASNGASAAPAGGDVLPSWLPYRPDRRLRSGANVLLSSFWFRWFL
ncbi:hypothetical protein NL676_024336 [Syzygium grande]|nr:hypothetical protein NL676_024336 [Syzygium grande]